jgi:hypothetical protein
MTLLVAFLGSLAVAPVALAVAIIALIRIRSHKVMLTTSDAAAIRAHRLWLVVGITTFVACLAITALSVWAVER